jgi:hypothetical protein
LVKKSYINVKSILANFSNYSESMVNWKIITGVVLAFIIGFASGALYMSYTIPKPVEKVHILFGLDWVIYGRHTAYFVALEKGFLIKKGFLLKS